MDKQSPSTRLRPASVLLSLAAATLLAALAAGCVIDVGDQACTPQSDVTDKDDRCPYGAAGGPRLKIDTCTVPPPANPAGCADLTWDPIFAILASSTNGRCGEGGCHDTASRNSGLEFSKDDAAIALGQLRAYEQKERGPYLKQGNPQSWMYCNLIAAPNTGGSPMPRPGGLTPNDIQAVTEWFACDALAP